MFNYVIYRQKSVIPIGCLYMENIKDVDKMIGRNLRRLRRKNKWLKLTVM